MLNVVRPGLTLVVIFTAVVVGATGPAPRFIVSSNSTVSPAQKSVAVWALSSAQSGMPLTEPVVPVFQVPAFAPDQAGLSPTTVRVMVLPLCPSVDKPAWREVRPLPSVKSVTDPARLP